ncbi:uncharacterized protein CTRU02_202397 [Colletotrichum truncatum]|uniref:Uncharacterized protein n=1 Tax=Colletotrichum truncatum TaxID=5467 RepID=A0ACC3ZK78_COLTU|nr:uncharacterized protein CTRU02_01558 [Colletotrichum truncatum]KAF6799879.1 hypothetical protein CTRU02_01558 [Colletotrichum truncatum]
MKTATACTSCRISKRKCWQPRRGKSCSQCQRNELDCSLGPSPTPPPPPPSHATGERIPADPTQAEFVSGEVAEALVEAYIQYIHDRPHSIFHVPTLRADVRHKQLHPSTYYALLSYGARLSSDKAIFAMAEPLFERARRHLHVDIEIVCLDNIQACILLAHLAAASLRFSLEVLYLNIGIRMAQMLHLNMPQSEPVVVQEVKRRIWWTLFMADQWCSAGNGLPNQMKGLDHAVDLPMDEAVFHQPAHLLLQSSEQQRPKPGLWAHMITLAEIFGPIQDLNRQIAKHTASVSSSAIDAATEKRVMCLYQALNKWQDDLPPDVRYSLANLCSHRDRGLGGTFVALHQGLNHYGTLLLYQYLDPSRVTNAATAELAQRCKQYANDQSALIRVARDLGQCETLHPGVGHNAAISSSVLLHTLLFGSDGELAEARMGLQSNLETLENLSRYWPSLELTVRRLTVFQEACLQSTTPQPYRFDSWLVKFLLEYHLPLDEKAYETVNHIRIHEVNAVLQERSDVGAKILQGFWGGKA